MSLRLPAPLPEGLFDGSVRQAVHRTESHGHPRNRADVDDRPLPWPRLGHFEILERIGQGGMGDVYKGYERSLDRFVAIKVLPEDLASSPEFVRRFYAEATAAARVIHPNIIPIHYIGEDQGCHYFAMQYVEGESLAQMLARRGRLSVNEALDLMQHVLAGLEAAHRQGLIHRDIKPGNILLEPKSRRAMLADFGLVKSLQAEQGKTATGVIMGTVDYISPEQGRGLAVDHRCDLYSSGVLFYQILSGQLPFAANSPTALIFQHVYERPVPLTEVAPHVPEVLSAVVAKLMAKSPEQRHNSAAAVAEDLQAVCEGRSLPSQADVVLKSQPDLFARPAGPKTLPRTRVISVPQFDEDPHLPEDIPESIPKGWWDRLCSWLKAEAYSRAPEWVDRLANTQQQVDLAVGEYERRQRRLAGLVEEAEQVLHELQGQKGDWQETSRSTDHAAIGVAELEDAIASQEDQLGTMRLKLAKVNATLETLKHQRDLLNARLRVATVGRTASAKAVPRRVLVVAVVLLFAIVGIGFAYRNWNKSSSETKGHEGIASEFLQSEQTIETSAARPSPALAAILTASNPAPLLSMKLEPQQIAGLKLASEEGVLLLVHSNGTIEFRNSQTGELLQGQETNIPVSENVVFDPSGKRVALWDRTSAALRIWDLEAGKEIPLPAAAQNRPVAFLDSGINLVSVDGSATGDVTKYSLETLTTDPGEILSQEPVDDSAICTIDLEGDWLAFRTSPNNVQVRVLKPEARPAFDIPGTSPVASLVCHPDKPWLAIGGEDGGVLLFDVTAKTEIARLTGHTDKVTLAAFDPTGRRLAIASRSRINVWDLSLRFLRVTIPVDDPTALSFSSNGKQLAVGESHGRVRLFDMDFPVIDVNRTAWLQRLKKSMPASEAEALLAKVPLQPWGDTKMAVSQDGRFRAIARGGELARVEATTGQLLHQFDGMLHALSIAISPNNKLVATGSYDSRMAMGDVRIWDFRSGRQLKRFSGHIHYANTVAFSADSKLLISGGKESLHVWDIASEKELRRWLVLLGFDYQASFGGQGEWAVATRGHLTARDIRVYDLQTGDALLHFQPEHGQTQFALEGNPYLFDSTVGEWKTPETGGPE